MQRYTVVLLGGLSGRLDQTIHTLSYLHKLRRTGRRVFAVTDDNVGWVLDAVRINMLRTYLLTNCDYVPSLSKL